MALTVGVEEEFLLTETATGRLVPRSAGVLGSPLLQTKNVTGELNLCQVESATPICHTGADIRRELRQLRTQLNAAAGSVGLSALAVGSHPLSSWREQRVNRSEARYQKMEDDYQQVAREQIICGCHVHIGIPDPDLRIATMTRARPWLAALVALTANSPFWDGADSGYDSYRTMVWRRWPTAGFPPAMDSIADYRRVVSRLEQVGAISDPSYIYWYIRPSSRYETLEFRASDSCMTVEDTAMLAVLVRAIAATCASEVVSGTPRDHWTRETLEAAMWRAARFGLSDRLSDPITMELRPAHDVARSMVNHLRDALAEHGDAAEAAAAVDWVLAHGNGATRQRYTMRVAAMVPPSGGDTMDLRSVRDCLEGAVAHPGPPAAQTPVSA